MDTRTELDDWDFQRDQDGDIIPATMRRKKVVRSKSTIRAGIRALIDEFDKEDLDD